jgi:drug/metabolite transporter (DMT)-like permease
VFRFFKTYDVNTPMAIVINYAVAAGIGWTLSGGYSAFDGATKQPWFWITVLMGSGFLFLFNLIAMCTKDLGVAVASISTKLSLIIPATVFILIDPSDNLSISKFFAFTLAIAAIVLATFGGAQKREVKQRNWVLLIPAIIFLGSGGIDLVFGYYSGPEYLATTADAIAFTSIPFSVAFLLGLVLRVSPEHRHPITRRDLIAGLVLGVINFGSLYFLLMAYENSGMDKSSVIPALNIGVVLFSTLAAGMLFKEKPSTKTTIGLVLGFVSIAILLLAS